MNAFRTVEAAQVVEEDEVVVRQPPARSPPRTAAGPRSARRSGVLGRSGLRGGDYPDVQRHGLGVAVEVGGSPWRANAMAARHTAAAPQLCGVAVLPGGGELVPRGVAVGFGAGSAESAHPDGEGACHQRRYRPFRHADRRVAGSEPRCGTSSSQSVAFRPDGTTATTTSAGGKPLWRGGHVALVR